MTKETTKEFENKINSVDKTIAETVKLTAEEAKQEELKKAQELLAVKDREEMAKVNRKINIILKEANYGIRPIAQIQLFKLEKK